MAFYENQTKGILHMLNMRLLASVLKIYSNYASFITVTCRDKTGQGIDFLIYLCEWIVVHREKEILDSEMNREFLLDTLRKLENQYLKVLEIVEEQDSNLYLLLSSDYIIKLKPIINDLRTTGGLLIIYPESDRPLVYSPEKRFYIGC